MEPKRIVCWFSCGAASAVATKLAIVDNAGKIPLVVARCIVREEHPDNERFTADCEKWFGQPIINLINEQFDGSIYNVFEKRKYISGIAGAPCTMLLKKEVRQKFEKPTDRHVFGYCADEEKRFDSFLDANNIDAVAPLIDKNIVHSETLAIIQKAGIELPTMYKLGYKHNNCVGCCKSGGQGYWNKIREDFPVMFNKMSEVSRRMGARLINVNGKHIFLDELQPGTGNYKDEPEIQCGVFCHMVDREIKEYDESA